MDTTSLRPNRLPLTDEQKAANRAVAPFGPVTSALYGRQDMRRSFEAGVALLTDGERDILREQARDAAPGPEDDITDDPNVDLAAHEHAEHLRAIADVADETSLDDLDLDGGW
jgi:hypothetical protein